jgi:hypothetical protein
LKKIRDDIYKKGIFGRVIGRKHVVEFQKRGLPHACILVILHPDDIPQTPEQIDQIVKAKIPQDPLLQPLLYQSITKHNIHGLCGP